MAVCALFQLSYANLFPTHITRHYAELFGTSRDADVAILGSSTGVNGVNPRYLEDLQVNDIDFSRTFNFSRNGVRPSFFVDWYQCFFRPNYQKPSLALIGVDWFEFHNSTGVSLSSDAPSLPVYSLLSAMDDGHCPTKHQIFWERLRSFPEWKSLIEYVQETRSSYYKGYESADGVIDIYTPGTRDSTWTDYQLQSLETLIDALTKDGIKVILFQPPVFRPDILIPGGTNFAKVAAIAEKKGVPLLNYNTTKVSKLNATPRYFANWSHLNDAGSEALTLMLKQDLADLLQAK